MSRLSPRPKAHSYTSFNSPDPRRHVFGAICRLLAPSKAAEIVEGHVLGRRDTVRNLRKFPFA